MINIAFGHVLLLLALAAPPASAGQHPVRGEKLVRPFACAGKQKDQSDAEPQILTDEKAPPGYQFRGAVVSPTERYLVQPRTEGGQHTATIVVQRGKRRYTADDVAITQPVFDGSSLHLEPGESDGEYEFHLSPDERWLFIKRRGSNHLFFGMLYHRLHATDTRMVPATSGGPRIDETAVEVYAKLNHLPPRKIGGGSRYVHFEKWDMKRGILIFSVAVAPTFNSEGIAWDAAYHFQNGSITFEKKDRY